jgi:hypothetical protein
MTQLRWRWLRRRWGKRNYEEVEMEMFRGNSHRFRPVILKSRYNRINLTLSKPRFTNLRFLCNRTRLRLSSRRLSSRKGLCQVHKGLMSGGTDEKFDFFLIRRGSVAAVAREVEQVLSEKGYKVFVQDYDIPLGANFINAMHEAIKSYTTS